MPRWDDEDAGWDDKRLAAIRRCAEIARNRQSACDYASETTPDTLDKEVWRERACEGEYIVRHIMAEFPEAFPKEPTTAAEEVK